MRKTIKNVVVTLLILTLSGSTALLAYLHFYASDHKEISGEWTAELNMTQQAAVTALSWLQEIEAVSISLEDMEAYMQNLSVQVHLTLEKTGRLEGTFCSNVLPESYDACSQAAYEAFATAFQDLLVERLRMAGYEGSTDKEAVEALVSETFGMSTVDYLMSCGPSLLPSLEEMQAEYEGSGTYKAVGNILTRQFDAGGSVITKMEYYIREDSNLILSEKIDSDSADFFSDDYPVIFTLSQPQN